MDFKTVATATTATTDLGEFEAIASAWTEDREKDVIHRGAFTRTIKNWRRSGKQLPLHWDHRGSPEYIIGHIDPQSMRETDDGLYVKGRIDLKSKLGPEVWRLVKSGVMGLSFGYLPTQQIKRESGGRDLHELDVFEITITPAPMHPDTRILSTKSLAERAQAIAELDISATDPIEAKQEPPDTREQRRRADAVELEAALGDSVDAKAVKASGGGGVTRLLNSMMGQAQEFISGEPDADDRKAMQHIIDLLKALGAKEAAEPDEAASKAVKQSDGDALRLLNSMIGQAQEFIATEPEPEDRKAMQQVITLLKTLGAKEQSEIDDAKKSRVPSAKELRRRAEALEMEQLNERTARAEKGVPEATAEPETVEEEPVEPPSAEELRKRANAIEMERLREQAAKAECGIPEAPLEPEPEKVEEEPVVVPSATELRKRTRRLESDRLRERTAEVESEFAERPSKAVNLVPAEDLAGEVEKAVAPLRELVGELVTQLEAKSRLPEPREQRRHADMLEADFVEHAEPDRKAAHVSDTPHPEPFSTSTTSNWVARRGGLPAYIQNVAHDLLEKGRAADESNAIEMAIGIIKNWAAGEGGVSAATRAKAAAALAEWERMKAGGSHKPGKSVTASGVQVLHSMVAQGEAFIATEEDQDGIDAMRDILSSIQDLIDEEAGEGEKRLPRRGGAGPGRKRSDDADVTAIRPVDPLRRKAEALALEILSDGESLRKSPRPVKKAPKPEPAMTLQELKQRCADEMLIALAGDDAVD